MRGLTLPSGRGSEMPRLGNAGKLGDTLPSNLPESRQTYCMTNLFNRSPSPSCPDAKPRHA